MDAVCILVTHASVTIDEQKSGCESIVTQTEDSVTIVAHGPWTTTALVSPLVTRRPHADANQPTRGTVADGPCHAITVRGEALLELPPLFAPSDAEWNTAIDHPECMLRISRGRLPGASLYRGSVLWAHDPTSPQGVMVDVVSEGTQWIRHLTADAADVIGSFLLNVDVPQSHALAELYAEMCDLWSSQFHRAWRTSSPQKLVSLMVNARTPKWVTRLIDPDYLLAQRRLNNRINIMGMSILRRMQGHGSTTSTDLMTSFIGDVTIVSFLVIPVPATRFATLVDDGCFYPRCKTTCSDGILYESGDGERHIIVPMNIDPRGMHLAIASLMRCSAETVQDSRVSDILLVPETFYSEACTACPPDETLQLYRLRLDAQRMGVVLTRDNVVSGKRWINIGPTKPIHTVELHNERLSRELTRKVTLTQDDLDRCNVEVVCVHDVIWSETAYFAPANDAIISSNARPIDLLDTLSIPINSSRVSRATVVSIFPQLSRRISNAKCARSACMREVQARRVATDWTLEGIDSGKNLSSLGMTVLLCTILGVWLGSKVRVAMSRTRSAMLVVFTDECTVLLDPTRTLCNLFDASDYLSSAVPSIPCRIRPNVVVEIRMGVKWKVAIVKTVDIARGQFTVQLLKTSQECIYSIDAHTWRRVSDDDSDLDAVVVAGMKRARSAMM